MTEGEATAVELERVDRVLAEDAIARLAAVASLLEHLEECEKCSLKYDLQVLLDDVYIQLVASGLEPNSAVKDFAGARRRP